MSGDFDLLVIGGGSGGLATAIRAARHGASVALFEPHELGGTCVNRGCVPKKAMWWAAELAEAQQMARAVGFDVQPGALDWAAFVGHREAYVARARQAYANRLRELGVRHVAEYAHFVDAHTLRAGNTKYRAPHVVIATGSRVRPSTLPGAELAIDSDGFFKLDAMPKRVGIIGGGYIGVELAQTFARVGVEVTLVFRSRLLPEAEPEIGAALAGYLADEGIKVVGGLTYESIRRTEEGVALTVVREGHTETLAAERVLVATGRAPNTESLGLPEAGIALTPVGAIVVDDRMRTSKAGVYAAGDVTGKDQFVYMAAYGAKLAAKNALNGDSLRYDNSAMPAVVFTDPQVGSVGLTEAQARAAGYNVRTSVLSLDNVPRALAARDTRGLIKLVADGDTRKLLGAHILAPEGADSIQTATMAIRGGLTIDDLAETIFPYLTTVEGLKLAAQTFDRDVKKLSCCAG